MMRHVVAAFVVVGGMVLAAAPGRAVSPVDQQNPNADRCAQIMTMLVGGGRPGEGLGQMRRNNRSWAYYGGEIGKAQADLRAAEAALAGNPSDRARQAEVARLKEEENRLARLINRFSEQLTELKCPEAPPADTDLPPGGGGGVTPPDSPPTPPPGGRGTTPPGGGRGTPPAPIDPSQWRGDWNTDMGTLRLQFNNDVAGTRDVVSGENAWGPASGCPENATVFGGEITWRANTNWGPKEIEAPVLACAVAGVLEGKFNNSGRLSAADAASGGVRVGFFKFTMSLVGDKYSFAGTVRRWDHVRQNELNGFSTFFSGRK